MPEVPAVSGTAVSTVRAFFTQEGALGQVVDGYEPRDGQRRMAEAVAAVVADGGTLLAEAGTGTGKTLAYLIPAILSGHRVLVSTGTKNLQEQIFYKDLPALQQALGRPFTATLMKGRGNYLCLHRWQIYKDGVDGDPSAGPRLIETGDRTYLPIVEAWSNTTQTGDRAELRDVPEDLPMWKEIGAHADSCLGNQCPRYGDCFVTLMRQRAADSDVVIVNHHLLCADASVRQGAYGEVIPACPTLVVDEAHQLEDIATQYFGIAFSNSRVDDLVRDGARLLAAKPFGEKDEDVHRVLARVADRNRLFFAALSTAPVFRNSGADRRARYTADAIADYFEDGMMLAGALEGLEATLALLIGGGRLDEAVTENATTLQRRANELRTDLRILMAADDDDYVYFIESRGRALVHARVADRRVTRHQHRPVRAFPDDDPHVRDPGDRGRVRLPERSAGNPSGGRAVRPVGIRLPAAGAALPADAHAAAEIAQFHRGRRARDDPDPAALARSRLRAVHELRGVAQACSRSSRCRCRTRSWCRGPRRDPRSSSSSAARRTRCCWPPPASGRASTSSAKR